MYKLLKPIPRGFQEMLQEFEEYIAETGLSRVKSMHGENVSVSSDYIIWCLYTDTIYHIW